MDIHYSRENVMKAVRELVAGDEAMPKRAWDAYMIATRASVRDGMEAEFEELDKIFKGIRHDEVESRIDIRDARRSAIILLSLYEQILRAR